MVNRHWITLVPDRVHMVFGTEKLKRGDIVRETKDYDQACLALLNTSEAPQVHLIDDLRGVRNIPPVSAIYNMEFFRHPRLGCYVTLGVIYHPVLRFITTRVSGLVHLRYTDAKTFGEAYTFLLKKDSTLPALETWLIPPEIREF